MQLSPYQSIPVPSTGNVCPALWCRNMDPLGCRYEDTGGFSHIWGVCDRNFIITLVGSCLQCTGASAIWFVSHWWHLASSTLISVWPCCMPGSWSASTWCSASDGGYLQRQNRMASWRRPPGHPHNVWLNKVQADANALPLSTLWRSEIARGHGVAQRSTRTMRRWWWFMCLHPCLSSLPVWMQHSHPPPLPNHIVFEFFSSLLLVYLSFCFQ